MIDLRVQLPRVVLRHNEPMSKYTAARLGGAADWVYIARTSAEELAHVVTTAWREGIPTRILGGGANVLISDQGVRGLVVINRLSDITFDDKDDDKNERVTISGGASLTVTAHKLQLRGLSGFEWAVSVPGTIGGAVVNNAGAHGQDMAAAVTRVRVIDAERGAYALSLPDMGYGYRTSALKHRTDRRFLVTAAEMRFKPDDPDAIKARMDENIAYRKRTQPPGASLGSIFKNPPGDYAGRLIESCGLKGVRVGGAQVSPVHANFFINLEGDQASASDYYALIRRVQKTVFDQTGISLETEIEWVGDWSESEPRLPADPPGMI